MAWYGMAREETYENPYTIFDNQKESESEPENIKCLIDLWDCKLIHLDLVRMVYLFYYLPTYFLKFPPYPARNSYDSSISLCTYSRVTCFIPSYPGFFKFNSTSVVHWIELDECWIGSFSMALV